MIAETPWTPEPTPRYAALVSGIHQATEDGIVSAETAWALIDDLDQVAWYDAWASAASASTEPACPLCGGAL